MMGISGDDGDGVGDSAAEHTCQIVRVCQRIKVELDTTTSTNGGGKGMLREDCPSLRPQSRLVTRNSFSDDSFVTSFVRFSGFLFYSEVLTM